MKGPGIRLDLDVRREWKCPQCGKRRKMTGAAVSVRCNCTRERTIMQLIETRRQTRSFANVIERVQQASVTKKSRKQDEASQADPPESEKRAETRDSVAPAPPTDDEQSAQSE